MVLHIKQTYNSRPWPDILKPPNGQCAPNTLYALTLKCKCLTLKMKYESKCIGSASVGCFTDHCMGTAIFGCFTDHRMGKASYLLFPGTYSHAWVFPSVRVVLSVTFIPGFVRIMD